jgi:hypothetical protein
MRNDFRLVNFQEWVECLVQVKVEQGWVEVDLAVDLVVGQDEVAAAVSIQEVVLETLVERILRKNGTK